MPSAALADHRMLDAASLSDRSRLRTLNDPESGHRAGHAGYVSSRQACKGRLGKYYELFAPGFLPGDGRGMNPEIRQSIPSTGLPSVNRVTLQRDISPSADSSDSEERVAERGIPVPVAISESSSWPCLFK